MFNIYPRRHLIAAARAIVCFGQSSFAILEEHNPKVAEHKVTARPNEDVLRLDIAVDGVLAMNRGYGID